MQYKRSSGTKKECNIAHFIWEKNFFDKLLMFLCHITSFLSGDTLMATVGLLGYYYTLVRVYTGIRGALH